MPEHCYNWDEREIVRVFAENKIFEISYRDGVEQVRFANVKNCYDIQDRLVEGDRIANKYLSSISSDKAVQREGFKHFAMVLTVVADGHPDFANNREKLKERAANWALD